MTSISAVLSIASNGLGVISHELSLVSQNVANAGTPNYAVETSTRTSVSADGVGLGVRDGAATRQIDLALQAAGRSQSGTVSNLQTRQNALQAIDAAQGTPSQGNDLSSLLGKLQNAFSTLQTAPDNQAQQSAVISNAANLAGGINNLSQSYGAQRQAAQDDLVASVSTLNTALGTIGSLTSRIIALHAAGGSTADLENERDTAIQTVSQLVGVKVLNQANGGVVLTTNDGMGLPINGNAAFTAPGGTIGAGAFYPGGGIQGITLAGVDVTNQLSGGQIGADLTLRDTTFPTFQGELDEFAQNLASRFDAQGLTLFTDPTGAVPPSGGTPAQTSYVGFAGTIQVNPQVVANISLVRDGTGAVAGSPTGASAFTPNPAGGPAGFTGLISRVLDFAFGDQVQSGVPQPASQTTGLGPAGNLSAPYQAPTTLGKLATTLVAAQSQESSDVTGRLATEESVQANINSRMQAVSGVNMDTEMATMIQLQNAYGANAKIVSVAQNLFDQILQMVH
jgi:flagellar hook-associated protein 1 FlgK